MFCFLSAVYKAPNICQVTIRGQLRISSATAGQFVVNSTVAQESVYILVAHGCSMFICQNTKVTWHSQNTMTIVKVASPSVSQVQCLEYSIEWLLSWSFRCKWQWTRHRLRQTYVGPCPECNHPLESSLKNESPPKKVASPITMTCWTRFLTRYHLQKGNKSTSNK